LRTVDQPVSLRWPGLDPGDTSFEGVFRLAYAENWQDFNLALDLIVAPTINVVYADTKNNIGYVAAGRIPKRGSGDGALPVPAADPRYDWQGYIPSAEMPRAFNPPNGLVVSANNKVVGDAYPHFISLDWAPPARAERITAMFETTQRQRKVRMDDVEKMQGDFNDLEAGELKDYLMGLLPGPATTSELLRQLGEWDGSMGRDQASAAVFNLWVKSLKQRMLLDRFKDAGDNAAQMEVLRGYVAGVTPLQIKRMLMSGDQDWCDETSGIVPRCAELVKMSLDDAFRELERLQGAEKNWQWGAIHQSTFQHVPFSEINLLDRVFGRRISSPGSENSVNVAVSRYRPMEGFEQTFGAVFRQVMSLAPLEGRHSYMNSTGQSGNPLSSHFDDMLEPFNRGEFHVLREPAPNGPVLTLTPVAQRSGTTQ
jgi:penicillin amidase